MITKFYLSTSKSSYLLLTSRFPQAIYGIEKLIVFGIFPIFIAHHQRRNERGQGGTIPLVPNHCGGPKSHNNVISTFFNTVHMLPKGLRFEHGGANLFLAPSVIYGNGNGLLFHMTQPTRRGTIKAIALSKPTISEH